MMALFSAACRLLLFLLLTLVCLSPYIGCMMARRGYRRMGRFYWAMVARWCLLATIVVRGTPGTERPLLMVSNHVSYVDIVVYGALIEGCFIAKSEVRNWPGIGFLARLARTVFVDRRPTSTGKQSTVITERLAEGEPLILFPEGTSSDGNRVLPFKSALFTVAAADVNGQAVTVQPLSITYTRQGGLPMGRTERPYYAWYGDMDLVTHLWALMCHGAFQVEVDYLPPTTLADHGNRKTLSRYCETAVRRGHSAAITGRVNHDHERILPSA
jgi:1-acyl-sn-glycerol-3-phosphate acyltransferase